MHTNKVGHEFWKEVELQETEEEPEEKEENQANVEKKRVNLVIVQKEICNKDLHLCLSFTDSPFVVLY